MMKTLFLGISLIVLTAGAVALANIWFQTDWSEQSDISGMAADPENQSGWEKYYVKDTSVTDAGGTLSLSSISTYELSQDDWSGGDSQNLWSDETMYFSDDGNIDNTTAGELKLVVNEFWWDTEWLYRIPITITNTSDNQAVLQGFPLSITIDHAAMVNNGTALGNGDDIRVLYQSGTEFFELPIYCENGWGLNNTRIWFKLYQTIAVSGLDSNYYLYYGNPMADSAVVNPETMFDFYDDFNDNAIDAAKWSSAGAPTEDAGLLTVKANNDGITSVPEFGAALNDGIALTFYGNYVINGNGHSLNGGFASSDLSTPLLLVSFFVGAGQVARVSNDYYDISSSMPIGSFVRYTIAWTTSSVRFFLNDSLVKEVTAGIPIGVSLPVTFMRPDESGIEGQDNTLYCDYAFVHKFMPDQPTIDLGSVQGYYAAQASLVSSTFTLAGNTALDTISWTPLSYDTAFGDNPVKFQIASNDDNATWDFTGPDGTSATYYTNPLGELINELTSGKKYFRYKVFLATADTRQTPVLDKVTVTYRNPYISTLTSSPYNSGIPFNGIQKITWTGDTPEGAAIKLQVRTAPDDGGIPGSWTPWLGPEGSDDYFTAYTGENEAGQTILANAVHRDGVDDQWFQYKIFLSSITDAVPVLYDVTIYYPVTEDMPAPQLTNAVPNEVSADGGTPVALNGLNFQTGASITVGQVSAEVISYSGTSIVFLAPSGAAGQTVSVTITNPDGKSAVLENALTFAAKGSLSVSRSGLSPINRNELADADGVPVLLLELAASATENIIVSELTMYAEGTGDDSAAFDAGGVMLLEDVVANGAYDSTGDRLISQGGFSADDGTITFSGLAETILAGSTQNWLVVFNFNGTASSGSTFSVKFLENTDITAEGASSGGVFAHGAPVSSSVITTVPSGASGTLTVRKGLNSPASKIVANNEVNLGMLQLCLNASSAEDIVISSVTFSAWGIGSEAYDIAAVKLYKDANANGALDAGIDVVIDQTGKTYTVDDGNVDFSGINQTLAAGQTVYWLLVYDLSAKALNGETFAVSVRQSADITATGKDSAQSITAYEFPIYGNTMTVFLEEHSRSVGPKVCFIKALK